MNTIDEIKNRLDIVDIISEDVKLKRSGKNYTGFCPFHANTRTPAFVVFSDSGTWRCFGECNEGGDVFKYVMKKNGWDFREALKALAERAGVKLEPLTPENTQRNERADQLRRILEETVIFYRYQLTQTEAGLRALAYLVEKRGITRETAEAWGIGYAPEGWDATLAYFQKKGYPVSDLTEAGLLSQRQDGSVFDRFRHRLMFPIRDPSGGMAGFGGRILNPDDVPKFMNSPQSPIFDKSRLLFGLDRARKAIRTANQAVIVEGYLDAVVLHQQGFDNAVSPMGTALTETQMRLLKRYTRRFLLALDPDAAGVKATLRGLEVARESLDRDSEVAFDARGLLHNEARLQADLRVCALPEGEDPDEIVLRDPQAWQRILENAKPIIYHVLDLLTKGQDTADPKVKSQIAGRILPLINDVPNPVERDAYRQQVARVLQVDESALLQLTSRVVGARRRPESAVSPRNEQTRPAAFASPREKTAIMERQVLAYLVNNLDRWRAISGWLSHTRLNPLTPDDFSLSEHRRVAELMLGALTQIETEPDAHFRENLPAELEFILEPLPTPPPVPASQNSRDPAEREAEEAVRLVLLIRQTNVNTRINQMRFLQQGGEAEGEPEGDRAARQEALMGLIKLRFQLDKALSSPVLLG